MKRKKAKFHFLFILCLILFFSDKTFGQRKNDNIQENYIHYTLESGLPTAVVYNCVQDKDGFMWFGSFAGLIRFDGHDFYTFTKRNGLPDNEIVLTSVDSFGRVWACPYSKKPIYLYKNKIHTEKNDSLLSRISNHNNMVFNPAKQGGMWILGGVKENSYDIYYIGKKNIENFTTPSANNFYLFNYVDTFLQAVYKDTIIYPQKPQKNLGKTHVHIVGSQVYIKYIENGFYVLSNLENRCIIKKYQNNAANNIPEEVFEITLPQKVMSSYPYKDKLYIGFRAGGYMAIDDNFTDFDSAKILLKEAYIGGMCVDKQGSLWLATMGQGIYCVPSHPIYKFKKEEKENKTITQAIFKDIDGELFVGNSGGEIQRFKENYHLHQNRQIGTGQYNRILHIEKSIFNPQDLYIVCDEGFFIWHNYKQNSTKIEQIVEQAAKCLYQNKTQNAIFIGTSGFLYKYNVLTQKKEIIIKKRVTAICEKSSTDVYIGSLDGLYIYNFKTNETKHLALSNTRLNCRVIGLLPNQENLFWVATSSDGLLLVEEDKILLQIDQSKGFSTDMLTSLCKDDKGNLWVGSIKGLHKIEFEQGNIHKFYISIYSTKNGLVENTINDVYVHKDSIFVATYNGLCFFKDFQGVKKSLINTYITSIAINGKDTVLQDSYILPFSKNTLSISFTGICFDYNAEIRYHYRLLGKQNDWQVSTQREVEFGALSAGEYIFEVFAMDKQNPIKRIKFVILPPWWQRTWVILIWIILGLIAVSALGFYAFSLYKKRIQKNHQEEKRVKELEIQAIRAQMNPHFIFNCLSSIQYFVNSGEIDEANIYMDKFAKLIRKTLHFSQNTVNSVADEVSYIENYLQLEQMRFEDKFQYQITISPEIEEEEVFLPSLILQPFVENAIRHGLRFKDGKEGILSVRFYEKEDFLICEIEDNGIGRKKAASLKSKQHIEYQSQGMLLSRSRLALFNTDKEEKMKMEVIDLENEAREAIGTLIRIYVSLDFE